jgi:3'(2'), 5'-bisphosphate nucleotidase
MAPQSLPLEDALQRDLQFALFAAQRTGERALQIRQSGRWDGSQLADIGDQACDAYLQGLIAGRYPEDGLLSEETADTPDRLTKSRVWIVDPLDGTREYMAGREDWAVHVGLVVDGRCRLGAVALPSQGKTLWGVAEPGFEAFGQVEPGDLHPIRRTTPGKLLLAASRSHTPPWIDALTRELDAELVQAGSVGNKVGMLLDGTADLYAHKTGLKEWDTCAPECLARAAGWSVSRLDGTPQVYNQADPRNDQMLVCRPADQGRILQALATCGALS